MFEGRFIILNGILKLPSVNFSTRPLILIVSELKLMFLEFLGLIIKSVFSKLDFTSFRLSKLDFISLILLICSFGPEIEMLSGSISISVEAS